MKPPRFAYARPDEVGEALELLAEHGEDAAILAGGLSLMPMLNMRLAAPRLVVDIGRLSELRYVRAHERSVEIGAGFRQAELGRWGRLADLLPLAALALPWIGHVQTRSRGTVGGSIAHADPSAELPLVLSTIGGEVVLQSARGERTLEAGELFLGPMSTAREPHELITALRLPRAEPDAGHAFAELSLRHGDFAIVATAADVGSQAVVFGVGGAADRPVVRRWSLDVLQAPREALEALAGEIDLLSDPQASADYRRHLIVTLGTRVLEEAAAKREGSTA